ncbi:hypothetical protein BGZ46_003322 [Entomortierella lignicola]|nr:hypothetical protein BGZ46_003322 [Entomortierella lignicola]
MGLDTVEKMTEQRQWGAAPFVVSSHRNADGSVFKSELQLLVEMCLYSRFRYSQEEAAQKIIVWRETFGPSEDTAAATATSTPEKAWNERSNSSLAPSLPLGTRPTNTTQTQDPQLKALLMSEYTVNSGTGFTPPPPSHQDIVVDLADLAIAQAPSPVVSNNELVERPGEQLNLNGSSAFVPTTIYTTPIITTEVTASQTRLELIHQSTGMIVDSSTRPNEIMDNNINTVQAWAHEPNQGSLMEMQESMVKVEIPFSTQNYQPPANESVNNLNAQQQQQQLQQQQASILIPGGFQSNAFIIPPSTVGISPLGIGEVLPDIWEAVESGDVETVQRHLNNGASPDQRNVSRSTLLHRAAWQCDQPYPVMRLLISYGANVNLANENGNTVLQNVLMKHDQPSLVKLLLDNGAESTVHNREGMNALEVAALFNKIESAKYLLENDISSSDADSIANALQRAKSPDKKAIKALLKSWQNKEGDRKRAELMKRNGITSSYPSNSQVSLTQSPDTTSTTSVYSVETNKGYPKLEQSKFLASRRCRRAHINNYLSICNDKQPKQAYESIYHQV